MSDAESKLIDHLDLMIDEFKRIKAISNNSEINGICDRAITQTKQRVPVIEQRDNALEAVRKLMECASELLDELDGRYDGASDSTTKWMGYHVDRLTISLAHTEALIGAREHCNAQAPTQ